MLSEIFCIAFAVYYEARGESWEGQAAVASVVINRVNDPRWPSDACKVLTQRNQFESYPFQYPIEDQKAWNGALAVASYTLEAPTTNALFFAQPGYLNYNPIMTIGNHIFYID